MAKRWSKLNAQVSHILDESLNLRLQCTKIRRNAKNAGSLAAELGVFTAHFGQSLIWDFPKQFVTTETTYPGGGNHLSYTVSDLNHLLREYVDTPREHLLTREFARDFFGLCHLLRSADRRLSVSRLESYFDGEEPFFVRALLNARSTKNAAFVSLGDDVSRKRGYRAREKKQLPPSS